MEQKETVINALVDFVVKMADEDYRRVCKPEEITALPDIAKLVLHEFGSRY